MGQLFSRKMFIAQIKQYPNINWSSICSVVFYVIESIYETIAPPKKKNSKKTKKQIEVDL